jgi:hypothetical protein
VDIDRIIRSVRKNGGKVSAKLIKEFPALQDERLAADTAAAILAVYGEGTDSTGSQLFSLPRSPMP